MAKKLLCVMLSVLMVVSLLPMGVMATEYDLIATESISYQNQGTYLTSYVTELCEAAQNGGYIEIDASSDSSTYDWIQVGISYTNYSWSSSCNTTTTAVSGGTSVTITITSAEFLAAVSDFTNVRGLWIQGGSTLDVTEIRVYAAQASGETTSRTNGVIYINEDYHGVLLTRSVDGGETTKTYLACVPHTVGSDGYCTVCHMYIGTDDESSTITVDGVEYEAAFSSDVNFASNDWNTTTLGDESFINALSTEGALLVITRDTETIVSYVSGEVWDKFFVGANYQYVYLSTVGTSTDDEDDLVAFLSDDGTTVVYDGATVYAALEAAGLTDSSSYTLGTNSSETYTITNVSVYVPVGTIVAEDVDVEEPVESTDTETEEDGDDLTVDDTDEVETPAETNPTTGVALALVPMAIAGLAVVSSKRR
ncbi:MAG: hypothetical protein LUE20_04005 [Oscillospiraceae bacterium]|nr:hypothetical protein [Oscillospiraceae bacterium]